MLVLFVTNSIAQEVVGELNVDNMGLTNKINYSVNNETNGNITTLLVHNNYMYAYLFDEDFNLLNMPLSRKEDNGKYNELVGHKVVDNKYTFIYTNSIRSKLVLYTFDFDKNFNARHEVDLNFSGERIVEAFSSYQNRFFIFFASVNGELILRELDNSYDSLTEIGRYKIEDKEFEGEEILFKRHFLYSKARYVTMGDKTPAPVSSAFSKYKLFNQNNSLILTVENEDIGTSVYAIDLASKKLKETFFPYIEGRKDDYEEFNSFVSNNRIFQISVSNIEMSLLISSLEGQKLKEFYVKKEQEIWFKNTVVVQEGSSILDVYVLGQKITDIKRNFESTAKFLRKISSRTAGVNVLFDNNRYEVIVGGVKDNVMSGILTVASSGLGNFDKDQITKITCLFDENLEHVDEDVDLNTYDFINAFEDDLKSETNSNIFIANGNLYYCYLYRKEEQLRFIEF